MSNLWRPGIRIRLCLNSANGHHHGNIKALYVKTYKGQQLINVDSRCLTSALLIQQPLLYITFLNRINMLLNICEYKTYNTSTDTSTTPCLDELTRKKRE